MLLDKFSTPRQNVGCIYLLQFKSCQFESSLPTPLDYKAFSAYIPGATFLSQLLARFRLVSKIFRYVINLFRPQASSPFENIRLREGKEG